MSCTLPSFHPPDADGPNHEIFTGSSSLELSCFKVLLFLPHAAFYHSIPKTELRKPQSIAQPPRCQVHLLLCRQTFDTDVPSSVHRPWHRLVPHTCRSPSFPLLQMLWLYTAPLGSRQRSKHCPVCQLAVRDPCTLSSGF